MNELASSGVKYNPDDVITITKTLSEGKVVGYQGRGTGRPIYYEFAYGRTTQKVAITVGNTGFIVGVNPVTAK